MQGVADIKDAEQAGVERSTWDGEPKLFVD